eukprot:COSAG01_NODE_9275_length_2496_cov_1.895286_4_plen_108_part_00
MLRGFSCDAKNDAAAMRTWHRRLCTCGIYSESLCAETQSISRAARHAQVHAPVVSLVHSVRKVCTAWRWRKGAVGADDGGPEQVNEHLKERKLTMTTMMTHTLIMVP